MAGMSSTAARWRDWVILVLAAWLLVSPWLLGYAADPAISTNAIGNAWVVGVVMAIVAIWAIVQFAQWHDWVNGILGVWLVISPWILNFSTNTTVLWNQVIVGVVVVVLAAWELWAVTHPGTKAAA